VIEAEDTNALQKIDHSLSAQQRKARKPGLQRYEIVFRLLRA